MEFNDSSPFKAPGRWYRGNTHTHTTVSDGNETIAERCASYRAHGYQFLCITDHNRVSDVSEFCDEEFIAIPGCEINPPNTYGGFQYHIIGLNIAAPVDLRQHVNGVLDEINAQGGLAIVAHPYYSGLSILDMLPLRRYAALEVYNRTCYFDCVRSNSEYLWDTVLDKSDRPIYGVACDDAHYLKDRFAGWIMVKSESLSPEAIVTAIGKGHFYATQGPEVHDITLTRSENPDENGTVLPSYHIEVSSSPVKQIHIIAHNHGEPFDAPDGGHLTEASWSFDHLRKYVRVELVDYEGKKAWTQPIWLSSLRRDQPRMQVFEFEQRAEPHPPLDDRPIEGVSRGVL